MAPTLSVLNYIQAASLSLLSGSSKKRQSSQSRQRAVNKFNPLSSACHCVGSRSKRVCAFHCGRKQRERRLMIL